MTKNTLDERTQNHLNRWIEAKYLPEDQEPARARVMQALDDYPEALDQGRSWPELEGLGS